MLKRQAESLKHALEQLHPHLRIRLTEIHGPLDVYWSLEITGGDVGDPKKDPHGY